MSAQTIPGFTETPYTGLRTYDTVEPPREEMWRGVPHVECPACHGMDGLGDNPSPCPECRGDGCVPKDRYIVPEEYDR